MVRSRVVRAARLALIVSLSSTVVAGVASAQALIDRLVLHGYLTQGYAGSDSIPVYGIPKDPTADYRTAALQVRYSVDDNSSIVLQMAQRRLGTSPLSGAGGNFVMDWAFFQSHLGPLALRIGRLPLPMGIYGETRDVGTLIPFYRAPASFYYEGFRSLDGLTAAHAFGLPDGWSLDAAGFVGGADGKRLTQIPGGSIVTDTRVERMYGSQGWLNTPVPGLRFGVTGMRFRSQDTASTANAPAAQWYSALVWSVDGDFEHVMLRGEYRDVYIGQVARQYDYYVQGGVKLTSKLGVYVQGDFADMGVKLPTAWLRSETSGDRAASITYATSASSVLKLERHHFSGAGFDRYFAPGLGAQKTDYMILSISVAF